MSAASARATIGPARSGSERRVSPRVRQPVLRVAFGDRSFDTVDWSMTGCLLRGFDKEARCEMVVPIVLTDPGLPGQFIPLAARVRRVDPTLGQIALMYEAMSARVRDWLEGRV